MKLLTEENFWNICHSYDALLVTTNGVVKNNNELVMGAGIAKQFAKIYPTVPRYLGDWVTVVGNHACCIHGKNKSIISMPTKTHFSQNSDLHLIARSAKEVLGLVNRWGFKQVLSVAPGCGMGNLQWADVYSTLEPIWDDRFSVIRP